MSDIDTKEGVLEPSTSETEIIMKRTIIGWSGRFAGLGISCYFLFIYGPSYVVRVPPTTNPADHALARTVVIGQLMQHEHQALVGIVLGLMLALVSMFVAGSNVFLKERRG